jgi:60 kDa SS-A/Ro ribonucleoprotein
MTYLKTHARQKISPPQGEPLNERQVPNRAGGFVFEITPFEQFRRFLILGTAGGTYYAGEREMTKENLKVVEKCIANDGIETVRIITEISQGGRAPKNDQAIYALAACIAYGDERTKQAALTALPLVCRIGTHLFMLVDFLDTFGTLTGRAKRRALARWYTEKTPEQVSYQAVKYRQRGGWSHRDVLRVSHPGSIEPVGEDHVELIKWIAGKDVNLRAVPDIVRGFEWAQRSESASQTATLVREFGLPREALKTEHLTSPEVWTALLETGMPLTAMIRNLGNMTRIGLLTQGSDATKIVSKALADDEAISKARVHPMNVLFALKTYGSGGGWRSRNTWTPVGKIIDALDETFYKAFGNVEASGKRIMLALDVSGSMCAPIGDTNLMCFEASAAMAMVTARTEDDYHIVGFSDARQSAWKSPHKGRFSGSRHGLDDGLTPLAITPRQRLDDVLRYMQSVPMGGTDCALPMLYANDDSIEIDTFVIYTDNETWAGGVHPAKALKDYRRASGIDAKLIVVGMTSTGYSIADPKDPGMLDVVGFDTATPQVITDFASGRI